MELQKKQQRKKQFLFLLQCHIKVGRSNITSSPLDVVVLHCVDTVTHWLAACLQRAPPTLLARQRSSSHSLCIALSPVKLQFRVTFYHRAANSHDPVISHAERNVSGRHTAPNQDAT